MDQHKNVPAIRFKGFDNIWDVDYLGNCLLIQRGGSPRPIENYITKEKEGINWIKIGDTKIGSRYIDSTKEKIRPEGEQNSRKVFPGDLILSNSMSFGRPYILNIEGCIHDGWLLLRDTKNLFDKDYLFQLLTTSYTFDQYKSLAAGGVVNNLNSALVQSTKALIPALPEQTQIGNFFKNIDEQINLQEQKHHKLVNLKKAMLEKMFPKEGANVPEIRFKGFTEKWDSIPIFKYVNKIIDFRGRTPKKLGLEWSKTGVLALSALNVKKGYIDKTIDAHFADEELYNRWMYGNELKKGQILFTTEAPMGNVARIPDNEKYILSQRTIAFCIDFEKMAEDYYATYLSTPKFYKILEAISSGGTAKGVSQKTLSRLNILIPKSIEEQQKIGNYFEQLDTLIQQSQVKIDKYKNIKQALLQKMFV